jgi:hypothetical protein
VLEVNATATRTQETGTMNATQYVKHFSEYLNVDEKCVEMKKIVGNVVFVATSGGRWYTAVLTRTGKIKKNSEQVYN